MEICDEVLMVFTMYFLALWFSVQTLLLYVHVSCLIRIFYHVPMLEISSISCLIC